MVTVRTDLENMLVTNISPFLGIFEEEANPQKGNDSNPELSLAYGFPNTYCRFPKITR
jgi:hypothetical protein